MNDRIVLYNDDIRDCICNIEDESVDCVVVDPPYKIVQGGCTNQAVRYTGTTHEQLKNGTVFKDNDIKFSDWIPLLYPKVKDGSHVYIMSNDRNLEEVLRVARESKFKLLNILTWKKSKHNPNRYYLKNSEFICMFRKGKAVNINNMGTFQVLEVPNVDKKIHPSEKPVDLLKILIENSSKEDDIVLDCFMGSGSTGLACVQSGRKFIGIEKDNTYYEIAKNRIEEDCKVEIN